MEEPGAWVIQAGTYLVRLGNSSAATQVVGAIQVAEDIVVSQGKGSLAMDAQAQGKVDWLTRQPAPVPELPADCVVLSLAAGEVQARPVPAVPVVDCSALSDEELACLCVGFGPGLPFPDLQETELPSTLAGEDGRPLTENDHPTGHNGYVSPAIPGKGIHSVFYKDGPAGIGQTGWPGEMLLACSFDRDVLRAMGDAIGRECEVGKVDVWLAPAINLHRHPLGQCGRGIYCKAQKMGCFQCQQIYALDRSYKFCFRYFDLCTDVFHHLSGRCRRPFVSRTE